MAGSCIEVQGKREIKFHGGVGQWPPTRTAAARAFMWRAVTACPAYFLPSGQVPFASSASSLLMCWD